MPSAYITVRTRRTGTKRFVVRYRVGGRETLAQHAGSFQTMKEAKLRRDLIAGELAAGRNPGVTLTALANASAPAVTMRTWTTKFLDSRIDIDANTRKNYNSILTKISNRFGDRAPDQVAADDVAAWVAELAATLKPEPSSSTWSC